MSTNYSAMKHHFDKLISGGYPGNGLELIRSTYEDAFGMKVNREDIYQTKLQVANNPIRGIITLIGPEPTGDRREIPTGIISMSDAEIFYVNHFTDDLLKGFDEDSENGEAYVNSVFSAMNTIVNADRTIKLKCCTGDFGVSHHMNRLASYAFYFTFHHIRDNFPQLLNNAYLYDILEKWYTSDPDDINSIIKSVSSNKYSEDPDKIYSIMTLNGTIEIV